MGSIRRTAKGNNSCSFDAKHALKSNLLKKKRGLLNELQDEIMNVKLGFLNLRGSRRVIKQHTILFYFRFSSFILALVLEESVIHL